MKRLLLALATLILLSVLLLTAFGNFAFGLFQEPYTGGWLLCLAGKCWPLP
jgi:hypothetical protein